MKNLFSAFLLAFLTAGSVQALDLNTKMGKPTDEEMKMTQYDLDPDAKAVILYSETTARFDYNDAMGAFHLIYFCKERIKVLTPEGVEAGNVKIPYYDLESTNRSEEDIRSLKVSTYNLVGGKVERSKMSNDLKTEERIDKTNCQLKFAAPNVKVGSVIEYEYELHSDYYFSPNTWYAQGKYPVLYTKYEIASPDWFVFNCYSGGICHLDYSKHDDPFSIFVGGGQRLSTTAICHTFVGKELPALNDGDFLYCTEDYSTRVEHELRAIDIPGAITRNYNTSWGALGYSLYKDDDFGGRYKMDNPLAEEQKALGLTSDMSVEERTFKLRELLWSHYKWNGNHAIWGASARSIRNDKDHELNMGSMNFVMMSMLRDAGITAYPVVTSRRSKGRLPNFPSSRYFNDMALRVATSDSTCFYLDPTAEGYPIGTLPAELLVTKGVVVYTDQAETVDLSHVSDGRIVSGIQATIAADGTLTGTAGIAYRGEDAGAFRESFRAAKDSTVFAQRRVTDDNMEIESYSLQEARANTEQVKEQITFRQELQKAGDHLYVNPFFFIDLKSPFSAETRQLPVEWPYASSLRSAITIEIPEGYEVEALPKAKNAQFDSDMYFRTRISSAENIVNISVNMVRKNMLITPDMYEELRSYYSDIETATQEMIVLKKKE